MTLTKILCLIGGMRDIPDTHDWELAAKSLLKSAMIQRGYNYAGLSARMQEMGLEHVSPNNLKSKINRGTFSAAFLIQAMIAMDCDEISIKNLPIYQHFTAGPKARFNPESHTSKGAHATVHELPPSGYGPRHKK